MLQWGPGLWEGWGELQGKRGQGQSGMNCPQDTDNQLPGVALDTHLNSPGGWLLETVDFLFYFFSPDRKPLCND